MGAFDDLIPRTGKPPPTGAFDDLIPAGSPSRGTQAARIAGQAVTGFNDAFANTLGAPADVIAWGMRQTGVNINDPLGGSEAIKRGIDRVATLPGRMGVPGFSPLETSRFEPEDGTERFARGAGEGVGNALTMMVPAGVVANTARAGTATQGVANALRTQPVMQATAAGVGAGVGEATDNPWLGLGAGLAVPVAASVGRGIISPTTMRLTPQEQHLMAAAQREGIPLTPGQRTGSKSLQVVEGTLAKMPGSAGPMQDTLRTQREGFNRAALSRAGVTADDASPETMTRAFRSAGQTFDDLASRTTVNVDPQFAQDVRSVATDYGRRLETNVAPIFNSYMDDLAPLMQAAQTGANPQVSGQVYQRIHSDIGRTIRGNGKNPDLQRALGEVQDALSGAMERSASGPLRQEWQEARREYQALMTIDKAMQGGTQGDRAMANVPFNALRGAVAQGDRAGYSRGRGQLNEMSRIGDFIADRVPDSGTVSRQMVMNPLNWPMLAAGAGYSRLHNSRMGGNYLSNQWADPTEFRALYAGEAARQGREEIEGGRNALSRRGGPR